MIGKLKLSASAAALALLVAGAVTSAQAADVAVDEGCTLSGAVGIGYMFNWQNTEFDDGEDSVDGDVDWSTPFGEGGGLVTCGGFNVQADFAYYNHQGDAGSIGKLDIDDVDADNGHFGGALFWRDPSFAALGVSASWVNQDVLSKDSDTFRGGLFGEFYTESFTFGASAHYFNGEVLNIGPLDIDQDGFELAAWGRFYATPDLSLMIRGDALFSNIDLPSGIDTDVDLNGWAISGEAEYLVWDQGLSVFGGLRYAERSLDIDDVDFDVDIEDTQVYAGLKFYFGQDGTLQDRQRTGTIDNTSVFLEKLPNALTSGLLGLVNAAGGGAP